MVRSVPSKVHSYNFCNTCNFLLTSSWSQKPCRTILTYVNLNFPSLWSHYLLFYCRKQQKSSRILRRKDCGHCGCFIGFAPFAHLFKCYGLGTCKNGKKGLFLAMLLPKKFFHLLFHTGIFQ